MIFVKCFDIIWWTFFELQNVEGALTQNRWVFATGLTCNTYFKKIAK